MSNDKTSTGSFFGDLVKAIEGGGASRMTKAYTIKKGDTLSTIAKTNGVTLKQLMRINPKFKTGTPDGSPTTATIKQKTMIPGKKIKVPDPKTFKNFRLTDVVKKPKKTYKKTTKADFKEMNEKLKKNKGGVIKKK